MVAKNKSLARGGPIDRERESACEFWRVGERKSARQRGRERESGRACWQPHGAELKCKCICISVSVSVPRAVFVRFICL